MACNLGLAHEWHRGRTRPAGCCVACRREWAIHHHWAAARAEALERSGLVCGGCGLPTLEPEVHHRVSVPPGDYAPSCLHHQANLVVLCPACHAAEHGWKRAPRPVQLALPFAA
jgi:5-methylcytosine-specific restriction endonuclease McrA